MARAYQVRSFDSLLKSRIKNAQMRQKIYKNLLTRLVQDERVVTTLAKCKDLSRVAERVCSTVYCVLYNRLQSSIFSDSTLFVQNIFNANFFMKEMKKNSPDGPDLPCILFCIF